jgi:PAS domain S-box-containing protein
MENIPRETSCYSTVSLIKYARQNNLNEDILFQGIESLKDHLQNPQEWISMAIWAHFGQNFEKAGGNLFNAGIEITENQVSHFQLFFLRVASLPVIINNISKHFEKTIATSQTLSVELKSKGVLDIIFTVKDKTKYSPQHCEFNRGCTLAVGRLKSLRNLKITEITCAARSEAHECRYRWTWTPAPSFLERIKSFFLFRFRSQRAILDHMEETYDRLQEQYKELGVIKDFYHHIMENMQEGIVWCDADGRISFVNKGFAQLTKREKSEECLGRSIREYFNDESSLKICEELFQACRAIPGKAGMYEMAFKSGQGEERIGQTACLWVDSGQQKPGFLLSIRDITERRKIERRLFAVENRYRSLYENSPAVIIGVDLDGYITYANPAMVDQSGFSEIELKKMHFAELISTKEAAVNGRSMLSQRLEGVGLQEVRYRTKSGDWKSLTLATFPLFDDDSTAIGFGSIGIDITETKRLNEILIHTQRMDLLGQMAGGLAHDFKNLLSVISGYSDLIVGQSAEPKIRIYGASIKTANDRAADLIRNLLTFSRGETVKDEPFVVNEVVREVERLLPPIIGKRIEVFIECPAQQLQIKGDSGKIHQSILNLCLNARDALSQKNDGHITLQLKPDPQPGWLAIVVEDNGPGIPPDIIGRIFDPFFSTKKRGEGTGLGLSVVYGIVKTHGGEIVVDSRPGEGATFMIRLPLFSPEAVTADGQPIVKGPKGRTVCIVDDNEVSRNFCAEILRRQNYTVLGFSAVPQCATWLQENPGGGIIALIPISQNDAVESDAMFQLSVSVIWLIESASPVPANDKAMLRRPFPPAALIEEVKRLERDISLNSQILQHH